MKSTNDTDKDCARAWEAMPWVLQDSAPEEQRAWLAGHLTGCEACREEFARQDTLRQALALPTGIQLDPEPGLRRLMGRIDAEAVVESAPRARTGSWITRALVAAVLVQAVGIGILGAQLWSSDDAHSPYRTLSDATPRATPGAIRLVPDTGMTLADWNRLLRSLQLDVVDGPNDVGAYTVMPAHAVTTPETLRQLRATRGIRLAEPVSSSP